MKTLVVLTALAAVALAAPALPEAGQPSHHITSPQDSPLVEKSASPQAINDQALHEISDATPLQLDGAHEPSARHLGLLKKPIIIKKKLGSSHLYRSSDEEQAQADPQENCMQEVKVKLCDAGKLMSKTDKMRSTTTEDALDGEVEHSIKMAKEAVENLQRGLLNMEHKSETDPKMSKWKHSGSGSDAEMHQDIEVARQALEHIQQNFGNLESMNLRAATLKDTDHVHENHQKIIGSDDDVARLVQWKEAIDNIQRNVEIAKNIEDSFKSADHEVTTADSKSLNNTDTLEKKSELHETAKNSTENQELNKHDADMRDSASTIVEMKVLPDSKINPLEIKATAKSEEFEKNSVTEEKVITNEKSTGADEKTVEKKSSETSQKLVDSEVLKSSEKTEEMKHSEKTLKSSEKSENWIDSEPAQTTLLMKSADKFDHDLESISAKKSAIDQEKSALKEPVQKTLLAHEKSAELDTTKLMKSVEQVEKKDKNVEQSGKSAEALKITGHLDSMAAMKSADSMVHQIPQERTLTHLTEPTKENNMKHEASMKAAEEAESMLPTMHMEMKAANIPVHPLMGKSIDLDSSMQPSTQVEKKADEKSAMEHNQMMQWHQTHGARGAYGLGGYGSGVGASAGMGGGYGVGAGGMGAGGVGYGAASAGGIGGGAGLGHGAGASAVNIGASAGSSGSSGAGAVGVFPNANVGGCAIPLLLSCSPSVVSGSLAKSHSSGYGAPAYRMGEDHFKYHFKRDTKKNEIPITKVKRTTKRGEKILLDKKL